jgi:hypothetical protein
MKRSLGKATERHARDDSDDGDDDGGDDGDDDDGGDGGDGETRRDHSERGVIAVGEMAASNADAATRHGDAAKYQCDGVRRGGEVTTRRRGDDEAARATACDAAAR